MKKTNKGFTLAEMLIVVAIIGVLIAIIMPAFTSQLERARETTDAANIRSAISKATTTALTSSDGTGTDTVVITQVTAGWSYVKDINGIDPNDENKDYKALSKAVKGGKVTVTADTEGKLTFAYSAS